MTDDASPAISSSSFPIDRRLVGVADREDAVARRHACRRRAGRTAPESKRDVDVVAAEVDRAGSVAHRRDPSGDIEARIGDVDMAEHLVARTAARRCRCGRAGRGTGRWPLVILPPNRFFIAQRRALPAAVNGHSCLRWLTDISGKVTASVDAGRLAGDEIDRSLRRAARRCRCGCRWLDTSRCLAAGS